MDWVLRFIKAFFRCGGRPERVLDEESQQHPAEKPQQPVPTPPHHIHVQPELPQPQTREQTVEKDQEEPQPREQRPKEEVDLLSEEQQQERRRQRRRNQRAQRAKRKLLYTEQLKQHASENQPQPPPPPKSIPPPPQQQQPRRPRRVKPTTTGKAQPPPPKGKRKQPRRSKPPIKRIDHSEDEHYKSLRERSRVAGDEMSRCSRESREAYLSGNGAQAKELSNQANVFRIEMDRLNAEARDWIFLKNNLDSPPNEFDLHGLYVKEAVQKAEECLLEAQKQGKSQIRLIVGKGLHSPEQTAKVKPAIEALMAKHQLVPQLDPRNAGVIVASLDTNAHPVGTSSPVGDAKNECE